MQQFQTPLHSAQVVCLNVPDKFEPFFVVAAAAALILLMLMKYINVRRCAWRGVAMGPRLAGMDQSTTPCGAT